MKKILLSIFLVMLGITFVACDDKDNNEVEKTDAPIASVIHSDILNGTATFTLNSEKVTELKAVLYIKSESDFQEVAVYELEGNKLETITFDNLKVESEYKLQLKTASQILRERMFITGVFSYETPIVEVISVEVNDDSKNEVATTVKITDNSNTVERLIVNLKEQTKYIKTYIFNKDEISNDGTTVLFDDLSDSKNYTIEAIAEANLGKSGNQKIVATKNFVSPDALNAPQVESFTADLSAENYSTSDLVDFNVKLNNSDSTKILAFIVDGDKVEGFEENGKSFNFKMSASWMMQLEAVIYDNGFGETTLPLLKEDRKIEVPIAFDVDSEGYNLIANEKDLLAINQDLEGKYRLANNIELIAGQRFTPIGYAKNEPFKGEFDGNGFEISNLQFIATNNLGLFATAEDAIIENVDLHMQPAIQYSKEVVVRYGALVGNNTGGLISNVNVSGEQVTLRTYDTSTPTNFYVGSVVGVQNEGEITGVTSSLLHVSAHGQARYVGGVVGYAKGAKISDSTITLNKYDIPYAGVGSIAMYIGGVVGYAETILDENTTIPTEISNSNVEINTLRFAVTGSFGGITGVLDVNSKISNSDFTLTKMEDGTGKYNVTFGGVAAITYGTILNSKIDVKVNINEFGASHEIGGVTAKLQTKKSYDASIVYEQAKIEGVYSEVELVSGGVVGVGGVAAQNYDGIVRNAYGTLIFRGKYITLFAAGIVADSRGETALVENAHGVVYGSKATTKYDFFIAGVVAKNGEKSTVLNSSGKVEDVNLITTPLRHSFFIVKTKVGGVIAENYGIVKNVIGDNSVTVDSDQEITIGGVVANNKSTDVNGVEIDAVVGGLIENAIAIRNEAIMTDYVKTVIYYGNIVGENEVVNIDNECGIYNVYSLETEIDYIINVKYIVGVDELHNRHNIVKLENDSEVQVLELEQTIFEDAEKLGFDNTVWNIPTTGVPTLKALDNLWMGV